MSMDTGTEQQMLDELRNQTRLLKVANRAQRLILVWLGCFSVLVVAGVVFGDRLAVAGRDHDARDAWREARVLVDKGEIDKGRAMISRMIARNPRNYYGYRLMGFVEQERGDLKAAETNFARACELFPTEENEKNLAAIRKVQAQAGAVHP